MVPNPDSKQYWNNWKNDISLFSDQSGEGLTSSSCTTGNTPRKHNGETHCAWAKNKIIIIIIVIIIIIIIIIIIKKKKQLVYLSKWLCPVSHSEEITMNEKPYLVANIRTLNLFFWTRMSVVEDKECKSCPSYYQSTGYYSEENEGVP